MLEFNIPRQPWNYAYFLTRGCFQGELKDCAIKNEIKLPDLKLNFHLWNIKAVAKKTERKKETVARRLNGLTPHEYPCIFKSLSKKAAVRGLCYPVKQRPSRLGSHRTQHYFFNLVAREGTWKSSLFALEVCTMG